jgi:hypothetical protein
MLHCFLVKGIEEGQDFTTCILGATQCLRALHRVISFIKEIFVLFMSMQLNDTYVYTYRKYHRFSFYLSCSRRSHWPRDFGRV